MGAFLRRLQGALKDKTRVNPLKNRQRLFQVEATACAKALRLARAGMTEGQQGNTQARQAVGGGRRGPVQGITGHPHHQCHV